MADGVLVILFAAGFLVTLYLFGAEATLRYGARSVRKRDGQWAQERVAWWITALLWPLAYPLLIVGCVGYLAFTKLDAVFSRMAEPPDV